MLFTPRKYGKDWTLFLAVSLCAGSLGFAFFALAAGVGWIAYGDRSDQMFATLAFIVGAIVFGVLGREQWKLVRRNHSG